MSNPSQKSRPRDNPKKRTCCIMNFTVPDEQNAKNKENQKRDKYSEDVRELKMLLNMRVTVIPVVIDALGTFLKGLIRGIEELEIGRRIETIQSTALLRSDRILRRVLEI